MSVSESWITADNDIVFRYEVTEFRRSKPPPVAGKIIHCGLVKVKVKVTFCLE